MFETIAYDTECRAPRAWGIGDTEQEAWQNCMISVLEKSGARWQATDFTFETADIHDGQKA